MCFHELNNDISSSILKEEFVAIDCPGLSLLEFLCKEVLRWLFIAHHSCAHAHAHLNSVSVNFEGPVVDIAISEVILAVLELEDDSGFETLPSGLL
jgi:hypothetical protein